MREVVAWFDVMRLWIGVEGTVFLLCACVIVLLTRRLIFVSDKFVRKSATCILVKTGTRSEIVSRFACVVTQYVM